MCNDPVLACALTILSRAYLIGAEDTNGSAHTSEFLLKVLKEYIEKAEKEFKVVVVAVTSDSASNMARMKELAAPEYPKMFFIPFMAHWLNLAAKDILGESAYLERIITILKWFSRNHSAHAGAINKRRPTIRFKPFLLSQGSRYHSLHCQVQLGGAVTSGAFITSIPDGAPW